MKNLTITLPEGKRQISLVADFAAAIMALRDPYENGHADRTAEMAAELALQLNLPIRAYDTIKFSAKLHDIGKLTIAEHVLNKPKLSVSEKAMIKSHSALGAKIFGALGLDETIELIIKHHHENWDGSGYPDHLAGEEIPIGARVLRVVDCFDAMTHERPYRETLTPSEAIIQMQDENGLSFEPKIFEAFKKVIHG